MRDASESLLGEERGCHLSSQWMSGAAYIYADICAWPMVRYDMAYWLVGFATRANTYEISYCASASKLANTHTHTAHRPRAPIYSRL